MALAVLSRPPFSNINNSWIYQNDFWLTAHLLKQLPLIFPSSCFCSSSFSSFSTFTTSPTTSPTTSLLSIIPLHSIRSLQFFRAVRAIPELKVKHPMAFLLSSLFQFPTPLFLEHSSRELQFKPLFPQYGLQLFQAYLLTQLFIMAIVAPLLLSMLVSSLLLQLLMFLQVQFPLFQSLSQLKLFFLLEFIFPQFEAFKLPLLCCLALSFQLQPQ